MKRLKDKKYNFLGKLVVLGLASFFIGVLIVFAGNILDFINPGKEYNWYSASGFYNGGWSSYSKTYHPGIDLNTTKDENDKPVAIKKDIDKYGNVYAIADGKVSFGEDRIKCVEVEDEKQESKKKCYLSGFGRHIGIRHTLDNGEIVESHYAHLKERKVEKGAKVQKGDLIGTIGKTGSATGIHLHFEIRKINIKAPLIPNDWPDDNLSKEEQQKWIKENYYDPLPFIEEQHNKFVNYQNEEIKKAEEQTKEETKEIVITTKEQTKEPSSLSRLWGNVKNFFKNAFTKIKTTFSGVDPEEPIKEVKEPEKEVKSKLEEKVEIKEEKQEEIIPVWDAEIVGQSESDTLNTGEIAEIFVKYKNSGNQNFTPQNVSLNIYGSATDKFYDSSWLTHKRSTAVSERLVEPNQVAEFRFKIKAPDEEGGYKAAFRPVYQIDHDFRWLGKDVVFWSFDVADEEKVEEAKLDQEVEDVVVEGVEFDESQEIKKPKNQENDETRNQEIKKPKNQENDETRNQEIKKPKNQEINKTKNFILFVGDGTPPEGVVVTFPDSLFYLTNQNHITIVGQKASDVAQINISLNGGEEVVLKNFIDENNWQYEVDLLEGENDMVFIAQDASKNSSEPVVLDIISDTISPEAPIVTTNGGDDFTTAWGVSFLGGTKENDVYSVFVGDDEAEIIDGNNWRITLNLEEGENLFQIFSKDLAQNSSDVVNFKITRNSSLLAVNLTDTPPALTNQTSSSFSFGAEVSVGDFYCQLDSGDEAVCLSPFLAEDLSEGWHEFKARTSESQTIYQWLVDLTPPFDPTLILNNGNEWTSLPEINSDISLSSDAAFWIMTEDSGVPESDDPDWEDTAEQNFSATFILSDSDETKVVYLWAMDEAGNVNSNAVSKNIILDSLAPTCEVGELASEQYSESFDLTINTSDNFEVNDWDVEYQIDGDEWQTLVEDSSDSVIDFTGEDGKFYGFRCRATDMAGNVSVVKGTADATTTVNLPPSVIINELMWMGSSLSTADEFIELKNNTDQDINLSGWQITRLSGVNEVLMLTIEGNTIIPADGYFLIANYNLDNDKSILNIEPDLYDNSVSLANNKLQIKLYDGDFTGDANLVDMADDGVGIPFSGALDNGRKIYRSMERNDILGDGTQVESWHICSQAVNLDGDVDDCGTPRAQNSIALLEPATIIDRDITKNTTWSASNNPYIVTREITIDCNAFDCNILTIEAGTIVKFMPGAGLILGEEEIAFAEDVYKPKEIKTIVARDFFTATKESKSLFSAMFFDPTSILEVNGEEGNEVIFTSIYDNYGGVSILNGSDISPQAGDWGGIVLNNILSAKFKHTIILYGENIDVYNSGLTMSGVEMQNNNGGVKVSSSGATVDISGSYLDNNVNYNIDNSFNGDFIVDSVVDYSYNLQDF